MNTTEKTAVLQKGQNLKITGLSKLHQAIHLIDAARECLCNLEGLGYCEAYEAAGDLRQDASKIVGKLDRLKPPTGVFKI
jgi:hypothetical protein